MNFTAAITGTVVVVLLASCAPTRPPVAGAPPAWVHAPAHGTAMHAEWWLAYNDPALAGLIQRGWDANPDVDVALRRVEAAKADRFEAMAALFPKAQVAAGFRDGREQNRMTGFRPDPLEPWTASADLSWEVDLLGKRRAGVASAKATVAAAHARWRGSRLLVATEIALARFEGLALGEEIAIQRQQLASEQKHAALNEALLQQGLISTREHADGIARIETARRALSEWERHRELARLRLNRLCGGDAGVLATVPLPRVPDSPAKSPASVWGSRPDLMAAEADVRAAFAAADAARLDLLPSLALGVGGELGSESISGQLQTWQLAAGPRLEIPVWDPARIAASSRGNAQAAEAAAHYRATALRAIEEIEGAYLTLERHRAQLASLEREADAMRRAWVDAQARTRAGHGGFSQEHRAASDYRGTAIEASRLRWQILGDHLALVRALGG